MRNFTRLLTLNLLYIILIAAQVAAIIFLCLEFPAFIAPSAAGAAIWLVNCAAALHLTQSERPADTKCALFALFLFLPPAGAIVYLLTRARRTDYSSPPAVCGCEKAEYFSDGKSLFSALLSDLDGAKVSIYIEFFIISGGELFEKVEKKLFSALGRGVEVKITYDGFGCAFKLRKKLFKRLKSAGAEIKVFGKIYPLPAPSLYVRDHRKIVVIDGKIAYTGGVNLADEYINVNSPYGFWKDTGVRVEGEAAKAFSVAFSAVRGEKSQYIPTKSGKFTCETYFGGGSLPNFFCDEYAAAIYSAKERVHIFTPYFCPPERIARALSYAAEKGVDVKVIIPHIPDKKYAFAVTKACASLLKKVLFYEYTPGFMHAKSMVCDGRAYIGSYNLDYRSACANLECGVKFEGEIAEEIEKDFAESLALSQKVALKCGLRRKIFARLFAPLI